jgi:hypothetical protein
MTGLVTLTAHTLSDLGIGVAFCVVMLAILAATWLRDGGSR